MASIPDVGALNDKSAQKPSYFTQMIWTQLVVLLCATMCVALDHDLNLLHGRFMGEVYELLPTQEDQDSNGWDSLLEFKPILNTIKQSDMQYYSFSINSSTGLGEYYQYLVFITGNICSQDSNVAASANQSLTLYYSFNSLMFQNLELGRMAHFENGYIQALADIAILDNTDGQYVLYMAVRAPQSTNTSAMWSYQIGVSQNELVFRYDNRTFVEVVDVDHESALVVTGNLTAGAGNDPANYNASLSIYDLYVYSYENKDLFINSNNSWCAIRNGPALFESDSYATSYTSRGGGLHQQFLVTGLNASTKYVGYLVSDFSGSDFGGAAYKQFEFETMSPDACALIYDLDFCDEVAYAVPALSLEEYSSKEELKKLYDNYAESLYLNFSKAMQQIACNTTNDAIFSPIRTCADCNLLYKNWLCAVTIPRCSTRDFLEYYYRDANESRSDFVNNNVAPPLPYYEVLPCIDQCQAVVRDCPAQFGFQCPSQAFDISLSYFWNITDSYLSCNYVGSRSSRIGAAGHLTVTKGMLLLVVATMILI